MTEVAAEIMQPDFPNSATAPAGVDQTQWTQYLADIHAAVVRLGVLQSMVPDATHESAATCDYSPSDNLSVLPKVRIQDMAYLPTGGGVVQGGSQAQDSWAGECSEAKITCNGDNVLRVGRVLGFHGASADNHREDTDVWYRPLAAAGAGAALKAADQAFAVGAGALILPFVCVFDLLSGKGCSFDEAMGLADKYNPVEELIGLSPGFGDDDDYKYVGLWHFIDVAAGSGFYNSTRGMLYEGAGPNGVPGVIDLGIMIGSDLSGLSLHASKSQGTRRYGQFDAVSRDDAHWQETTLGHTEFSPISHMGSYGWQQFVANPTSALPLTWPLHALGDAAEPHHVAGTTSYGHRPFEDEADNLLDTQLLPPPTSCTFAFQIDESVTISPEQSARILRVGFDFWSKYHNQFAPNSVPVEDMVIDVAQRTLVIANSDQAGIFNDYLSLEWHTGLNTGSSSTGEQSSDAAYESKADAMRQMLELGSGAMIAFLTGAAKTAQDPGPVPNQVCPAGTFYDSVAGACGPQPPQPPSFVDPGNQLCAGGDCQDAGASSGDGGASSCPNDACQTDADCGASQMCSGTCCVSIPR